MIFKFLDNPDLARLSHGPKMVSNWSGWNLVNLHIPPWPTSWSAILLDRDVSKKWWKSPNPPLNLYTVKFQHYMILCILIIYVMPINLSLFQQMIFVSESQSLFLNLHKIIMKTISPLFPSSIVTSNILKVLAYHLGINSLYELNRVSSYHCR